MVSMLINGANESHSMLFHAKQSHRKIEPINNVINLHN
jgi:hypothetical protein